ncbi:MAG TPA: HAMP domain-containing sensor histidine kinase [Bacteroidales bacterium]|nr:HAMP domain-containing sensor histidine kinase [Bacteroidales bacterium]
MLKLKTKLSLFNLLSKIIFTALFLALMPFLIQRINLRQVDNDLIQKREQVIELISEIGIEPFISSDSSSSFGSYNILKEEFISLEKINITEDLNYIDVTPRLLDEEETDYRVLNYSLIVDGQKYLLEVGRSLDSILRTEKNIKRLMLIFLVSIILITFFADLQYTRVVLLPLDKIRNKLKQISDPSLFEKTPVKTSTSDFVLLDKALIELMDHINILFQKEKEITVNISHELMTPVSVLRSKLENILLEKELDPVVEKKTEESLTTLHRLQSLVSSLLMIARIESHQYLREDTFSLKDLLTEMISEISPVADDAGIRLLTDINDDLTVTRANKSLIFSLFFNIVNNAIKNTPREGEIRIKGKSTNKGLILSIEDTGKGLSDLQKKMLFERFRMKDPASSDGTGIGLAIAKSIADFHDIKISVSSEPGKGTIFSFVFSENS